MSPSQGSSPASSSYLTPFSSPISSPSSSKASSTSPWSSISSPPSSISPSPNPKDSPLLVTSSPTSTSTRLTSRSSALKSSSSPVTTSASSTPPASISSDAVPKSSIVIVGTPTTIDACVQCELDGFACSLEQLFTSENMAGKCCLRCTRKGDSLCMIQSWSQHFIRRGELRRIREFRAADINVVDLEAIQKYGDELLDEWEEKSEKKNWVLPRWELDKKMKTRKVLWRMILWDSANRREGKSLTEKTCSVLKSACALPGLIDFL